TIGGRVVCRSQAACGRTTTKIFHPGIASVVDAGLEHEARGMRFVDDDVTPVDSLAVQRSQQIPAERIASQTTDVADAKAEAAQSHRHVQFGAGGRAGKRLRLLERSRLLRREQD